MFGFSRSRKYIVSHPLEKYNYWDREPNRSKRNRFEILSELKFLNSPEPKSQIEFHWPDNQTNPKKGKRWKHIVTMARLGVDSSTNRLEVLNNRFENQIKTWDVISTSMVTNMKANRVRWNCWIHIKSTCTNHHINQRKRCLVSKSYRTRE